MRETPSGPLATGLFCRLANLESLTPPPQRTQQHRSRPRNECSFVPFPCNLARLTQSANLPPFWVLYDVSVSSFHRPTRPAQHRRRQHLPSFPARQQKSSCPRNHPKPHQNLAPSPTQTQRGLTPPCITVRRNTVSPHPICDTNDASEGIKAPSPGLTCQRCNVNPIISLGPPRRIEALGLLGRGSSRKCRGDRPPEAGVEWRSRWHPTILHEGRPWAMRVEEHSGCRSIRNRGGTVPSYRGCTSE